MAIFTDEYLNYLMQRAEVDFSQEIPCIFTRFSLDITQGTSEYALPAGIVNLIRVTWKGDRVSPMEHTDTRQSNWMKPQNLSSQGKPMFYLSREYGYGQIKFHPVPHETVADDDTNVYGSDIENRVIVSAYRLADPTGTTYRLPEAIRQRYGKYYVLYKAYQREGKGQDMMASEYFKRKHDLSLSQFKKLIMKIPAAVRVQLGPTGMHRSNKPPRPSLPSDGAWGW